MKRQYSFICQTVLIHKFALYKKQKKQTMKVHSFLFSFLFASFIAFGQETENPSLPFGVNLAGAEFGHGSRMPGEVNKDYFYPTLQDLDYWKSNNLPLLRVPFKWEHIQHEPYGELTAAEVEVLKNLLKEADKRDLKIILDLHNYGRRKVAGTDYIIGHDSLAIEAFSSFWSQLVKALKGYEKSIYGYGLINEPHDMLPSTPWVTIAQAAILEIRKLDMQTPIIVGGNHWSSADRWQQVSDELKLLYDPAHHLIFEAHVYFDEDASGIYRRSYDEEKANPFIGVERLRPFVKWLKENKLKGFVGEYGIPPDDERWAVCLNHLLAYMHSQGINGTYWAAGAKWNNYILGVQPRNNYTQDMPQLKTLVKYK
ncbi:MAG: Endoglucanase [Candidatus Ordinivivax streblomastigis]|uniref:Endoglucanase n=1 Tax=Candidatus Ordinivivax streblomastigis TaxID=2540710 RepID=A0A5M8NZP4_9BACT|nr:MAG: Endoglucanase [Candidatus Ordinivivax streblomastigis]